MATLIIINSRKGSLGELWSLGDENPTICDGFMKTNQKWPPFVPTRHNKDELY